MLGIKLHLETLYENRHDYLIARLLLGEERRPDLRGGEGGGGGRNRAYMYMKTAQRKA